MLIVPGHQDQPVKAIDPKGRNIMALLKLYPCHTRLMEWHSSDRFFGAVRARRAGRGGRLKWR